MGRCSLARSAKPGYPQNREPTRDGSAGAPVSAIKAGKNWLFSDRQQLAVPATISPMPASLNRPPLKLAEDQLAFGAQRIGKQEASQRSASGAMPKHCSR